MKSFRCTVLATAIALSAASVQAGGPVVIVDEPEVVAETPRSGTFLPLLLLGVVLCVALCRTDERRFD